MTKYATIGSRIRAVRKQMGLTQQEFTEDLGISQTHISKIETGQENASDTLLKLISVKFNISYDWIINGRGGMYTLQAKKSNEINAVITEALKLQREGYNFNRSVFENIIFDLRDTCGDQEGEDWFAKISNVLDQYISVQDQIESNLESLIWDFPSQTYFNGFLNGFQLGFTMFQYMEERHSNNSNQ